MSSSSVVTTWNSASLNIDTASWCFTHLASQYTVVSNKRFRGTFNVHFYDRSSFKRYLEESANAFIRAESMLHILDVWGVAQAEIEGVWLAVHVQCSWKHFADDHLYATECSIVAVPS